MILGNATLILVGMKKDIEAFLENLQSPVCILTAEFLRAFSGLLSLQDLLKEGSTMKNFVEKLHINISTSVNNFFLDLSGQDNTIFKFKGRCVRNADMELESVVIVGFSEEM